jgi:hypothetical protein
LQGLARVGWGRIDAILSHRKKQKNVVGEEFPPGEQQATPLDSGAEHQT